ncbi:hypothetical protein DFH08DRAFT_859356 [Mycena albidolilacea]|uniref:DUF1748-domain-containing protein n=1 Tax=Mycena albidolilacea TaxID=1033008 RepID=A0AAD7EV00_9AGAR|nr:hypothetical protein DFH08DRAFT_859356 [Mycena albidolilacea]
MPTLPNSAERPRPPHCYYFYTRRSTQSCTQPMAIARLFHYAFDAVLLSTVAAGVRRSSGFTPNSEAISDPTLRSIADRYLGVGETIFDMIQATAVNSTYFKRDTKGPR